MLWSWLLVTLGHSPLLAGGWLSNHLIIIIHGSISLVCVPSSVHPVAYLIISAGKLGKSGNVKCTQIVIVFLLLIDSCEHFEGQPQSPQTIHPHSVSHCPDFQASSPVFGEGVRVWYSPFRIPSNHPSFSPVPAWSR